jgi:hypothetical protein
MLDVTDIYSDCEQTICIPESRFLIRPERDELNLFMSSFTHGVGSGKPSVSIGFGQVSFENVDVETLFFACPHYRDNSWCLMNVPFWAHKELSYFRYFGNERGGNRVRYDSS